MNLSNHIGKSMSIPSPVKHTCACMLTVCTAGFSIALEACSLQKEWH